MLTADRLRELLHYDPETGIFTRKVRTAQRHHVGDRADFPLATGQMAGYFRVTLDSTRHLAHRLAWLYMYGEWPKQDIDHRDTNRGNNRITNLREATGSINTENMRLPRKDNKCGFLGVVFHAPTSQWRARIQVHGKGKHIGLYPNPEAAHEAYVKAKRKYHEGCTI